MPQISAPDLSGDSQRNESTTGSRSGETRIQLQFRCYLWSPRGLLPRGVIWICTNASNGANNDVICRLDARPQFVIGWNRRLKIVFEHRNSASEKKEAIAVFYNFLHGGIMKKSIWIEMDSFPGTYQSLHINWSSYQSSMSALLKLHATWSQLNLNADTKISTGNTNKNALWTLNMCK